jgi:chorismate mutase
MVLSTAKALRKAVDHMRFTAFFSAPVTEGDIMEHSVLEQVLQAIEASDQRIAQLLAQRQQLASQLAQALLDQGTPYTLEERVDAVVSRLTQCNPGPLDNQRLASIFETVVRGTEPLSVGLSSRNGAAKKG